MNRIVMVGRLGDVILRYSSYGEEFIRAEFLTERLSGTVDCLQIVIPERLIPNGIGDLTGRNLEIRGDVRSRNTEVRRLDLYVWVSEIAETDAEDYNYIEIDGFICKTPTYRETPNGRRITDLLIASNRMPKKSAYIPCLAWGRNAIFTGNMPIGTELYLRGRLQSRDYMKQLEDGTQELRTTYEVSVRTLEIAADKDGGTQDEY